MIPVFRFGSEQLATIHNSRVPEWDGVTYNQDGNRRLVWVYPAGMHFTYVVDHGEFAIKSYVCGGLTVPVELEVIPKQAVGRYTDVETFNK